MVCVFVCVCVEEELRGIEGECEEKNLKASGSTTTYEGVAQEMKAHALMADFQGLCSEAALKN